MRLHLYTASYLEFEAMFGAYVRFKCNYVALRKSSDNQQQHLLTAVDYWKRDVNVTVNIITKEDIGLGE